MSLRMNRPFQAVAALAAALACIAAWAQDAPKTPPSGPLSLEACVTTALGQSPVELSAQLSTESATHSANAAKAPYYPTLGFNLAGSRWQRRIFLPSGLSFPGQPVPTIVGPTDDYSFSFGAAYTLFDGGERKAQLAAARAQQQKSVADAARTKQDLVLGVHQAFYALASAQAQLDVAQKSLARSEDHLRLARLRKEAGTVPLVDVTRAESEVASARLSLIRAENAVRMNRGRLATAMGLPASTSLDISPSVPLPEPPDDAQLQEADRRAQKDRPALLAAAQGVEAARQGVNLAHSSFSPKVSAAASYGREDASWYPQDQTWLVGVNVSIPIFTGFSRKENLAKAKVDLAKTETDARQAALVVREQVWDAFSGVRAAHEAILTAEALVASARESERLAKARYESGAGTISDLLDAETTLARAEASQVAADWDYRTSLAQFRWSYGDLTF